MAIESADAPPRVVSRALKLTVIGAFEVIVEGKTASVVTAAFEQSGSDDQPSRGPRWLAV